MSKIKICGLFRLKDIEYVNKALPDYIGLVFAKSRRQVTRETAISLREQLDKRIIPVGVFVNEPAEHIAELYNLGVIQMAQLHGQESDAYIKALKQLCDIPIIKAVRVDTQKDIQRGEASPGEYLLLDNGEGGTGKQFEWSLISNIKKPYFLAGGINEANIQDAMDLHPFCIDISSGAESNGKKDRDKILNLVQKVRGEK